MTQKEKDILLKDLCAKSSYGIKVQYGNEIFDVEYVCPMYEEVKLDNHETWTINIDEVKPYLFPLSSMTEEQKKELDNMFNQDDDVCEKIKTDNFEFSFYRKSIFDFLNKHHFDWRGLIPMGLANDATGLNIY